MQTLLHHIRHRHDPEAAGAVGRFFERAGLPVPFMNEVFESTDSGILLFLNEEASVLRFVSPYLSACTPAESGYSIKPVIDPDVLQPFGRRKLSDRFYIEAVPGIKNGSSLEAYKDILERLLDKGFLAQDYPKFFYRNSGLLPDGTPVILDRGAVTRLSNAVQDVKTDLGPQARLFKPLRQAFRAAWPKEGYPDRALMISLWQECRRMKKDGILVAGWQDADFLGISQIQEAALKYQARRHQLSAAEGEQPLQHRRNQVGRRLLPA